MTRCAIYLTLLAGSLFALPAKAQDVAPEAPPAPAAEAKQQGPMAFIVVEVERNVSIAPTGTDAMRAAGWKKLKVGDRVTAGNQVRVGLRSKVKLSAEPAEPPTVVLIENGIVNFSDLAIQNGTGYVRMQMPYGSIKAGVAETETRSDMEIESPQATLSKKGTDIFGFEVQPNGSYRMFLTEQGRGLLQEIRAKSLQFGTRTFGTRYVTPGQWITSQLARAIDNLRFDRTVNINDVFGLKGPDQLFTLINNRGGFGQLLPFAGTPINTLFNGGPTGGQMGMPTGAPNQQNLAHSLLNAVNSQLRFAPGGDFGIGQGTIPGVFDAAQGLQRVRDARPVGPFKALRRTVNPLRRD